MDKDNEIESNEGGFGKTIFQITEKYLSATYDIRYNVISNDPQFKLKSESLFVDLNIEKLYITLQNRNIKISIPNLTALLKSGYMENYNPLEEYFKKVSTQLGDDKTNYIENVANCIKAKNQERFNYHFKKMLIRTIACSLDHVVNKQAFILVQSDQNYGKTHFLRWLCPPDLATYFTENINTDKDSLIALCENFLINMDELANMGKHDIDLLKSLFSKVNIKVRRPFERRPSLMPRRANFIGSTNKTEFLTDETGSVRWLCFDINDIDWDYEKIDINKVWAQAFILYKNKVEYVLSRDEIAENEKENKKHQKLTLEIDLIQRYYLPGTKTENDGFYTASDFLKYLPEKFGIPVKISVENIGKALKILGFEQSGKFNGLHTIKGYFIKNNTIKNLTQLQDN